MQGTNATFAVSQSDSGIVVTTEGAAASEGTAAAAAPAGAGTRRKRSADRPPLLPERLPRPPLHHPRIPVGCESVFPAGVNQKDFSISTDFYKLNPYLRSVESSLS